MFESFVIVVFESLDCPRCEKMNLKSYSYGWKVFIYAEDAVKLKNVQDMRIILKNRAQFNCSGQTRDS